MAKGTVLLTRPAARNAALAVRLREAGLAVHEAPALEIHPLATPRPQAHPGDLYLFVSRHAVEAYFSAISDPWPAGAWAGAVGAATAQALRAHVPEDCLLVPATMDTPDSESLLTVIDARVPTVAAAHILRAQQGRDWLSQQLQVRGWHVACYALYERRAVLLDRAACEILADPSGCVLLATSLESLQAIDASLRHHGLRWPDRLQLVTLHERMVRQLQCWYADRPQATWHATLSTPDDTALFHAILAASCLLH